MMSGNEKDDKAQGPGHTEVNILHEATISFVKVVNSELVREG